MAQTKVPVLDAKFDPSDPEGTARSGVMTVLALLFGGVLVATAAFVWNYLASRTPDVMPEVEIA